jgi:hypothetical protein
VATFGASTFFLLILESLLPFFADGVASGARDLRIPAGLVALLSVIFSVVRFRGAGHHVYYSIFYILTFLILRNNTAPENTIGAGHNFLLYISLTLTQGLRAGRFPGWPVIAFLAGHWLFVETGFRGGSAEFREIFTFVWAVMFALFLESVLHFAAIRYLELISRRRKEDADLEMARRVHESLFPGFVENEHLRLHVYRSPENHTGGDFYDLLQMRDGNLAFFFADVAGHGISSAMMSAAMKVLLAGTPYNLRLKPAALLDHLDEIISREYASHHASGVYIFFNFAAAVARFANAGHPAVLHAGAGEAFEELESSGSVLGYRIARPIATEVTVPLRSGDRFLLYTDGLTEYRPRNGAVLDLQMEEVLAGIERMPNSRVLAEALQRIQSRPDFGRFRDDVMLALIEIK